MTDLDTQDPLHGLVQEALLKDAQRAPRLSPDWNDADTAMMAVTATRPSRVLVPLSVAAALVLVATLTVATDPFEDDNNPSTAASPWVPFGTEFPLTDLGPATSVGFRGPVVAALTRQVSVEGHPTQLVTTSLDYMGNETAVEEFCTWEGGSGGCRPSWVAPSWSFSVTSSVDNGYADYDLLTIEGLPADVVFVSLANGSQPMWQRPVMGFAAFPNPAAKNNVLVGYDASGTEVGRFDERADGIDNPNPLMADVSREEFELLADLTHDELQRCLVGHGGTLDGGVATFPDGVDQLEVWTACVTSVQQVVANAVKAVNPRLYDPSTERPENPDTPFNYHST